MQCLLWAAGGQQCTCNCAECEQVRIEIKWTASKNGSLEKTEGGGRGVRDEGLVWLEERGRREVQKKEMKVCEE